jgi:choline kinase
MTYKHNTIILAAGSSSFQLKDGSFLSKPGFNFLGTTLIEKVRETFSSGQTYLAISEDLQEFHQLDKEVSRILVGKNDGALITALVALKDCDLSLPLFIVPGDAIIPKHHFDQFCLLSLKGKEEISLVVFNSHNPNYSYVRMNNGKLIEVCEKKVISSQATTGIFYFRTAELFIECAEWAIFNNIRTNGAFFLAPALNFAVVKGINPSIYEIPEEDFYRFAYYDEAVISKERYENANKQN